MEVTSRFRELDLVHRVPEEPWMEVCNTVQEAVAKTISKKKECKKARWLSEEALQIAEERREVKGKGKGGRYMQLNAEFQRVATGDLRSESEVTQSYLTLCDPVDYSPPGFSIHGILQARILEWVAFPSPGDIPSPGIEPRSPALQADALPSEPSGRPRHKAFLN